MDIDDSGDIPMSRQDALLQRYGELMSLREITFQLKLPSVGATLKAHQRGRLGVPLLRLPGRRSLFTPTRALARLLDECELRTLKREARHDVADIDR